MTTQHNCERLHTMCARRGYYRWDVLFVPAWPQTIHVMLNALQWKNGFHICWLSLSHTHTPTLVIGVRVKNNCVCDARAKPAVGDSDWYDLFPIVFRFNVVKHVSVSRCVLRVVYIAQRVYAKTSEPKWNRKGCVLFAKVPNSVLIRARLFHLFRERPSLCCIVRWIQH